MRKRKKRRVHPTHGCLSQAYRHDCDILFAAYFDIHAMPGLVVMRSGTASRSRVLCLAPEEARGYADAFERGAGYARAGRTETLLSMGYPYPEGNEAAWIEAIDAWGRRQSSWQEATASTNGHSGVGVMYCHVVIFGLGRSRKPTYLFLSAEDAETLAPLLRHRARNAADMTGAIQLFDSMTSRSPCSVRSRDRIEQLLAGQPWPPG